MIRIFQWYRLAYSMGLRYVFFRLFFELSRKSGLLKQVYPVDPKFQTWITLGEWRQKAPPFFFKSRKELPSSSLSPALNEKAQRILKGEVQFFQGEWKKIESNDWHTNVSTGYKYDATQHWTEIPDFHPTYGDIKYVWERSRFSFIQTILRYDVASGLDSSEWVFAQIESWIERNPINRGPNYQCSQEISLRIFNWTLALYFYREAPGLTEERFERILFHIYWQLRHVRANINFSRIAVRNNHAITEALALYTAGLLFPFFEEAAEWKVSGKRWFEEEIAYQIYEDGTYLQFSFNYHRVVIQLLTWAISIAHQHEEKFNETVYHRSYASLKLLLHSQDAVSGQLPNYGANDGSLFFQWNDEAFRNYRHSLDTLHFLLTSANVYEIPFEDRQWFGVSGGMKLFSPISVSEGVFSFAKGGIYGFRNNELLVWVNCVMYHNRPSQADALHLDVWFRGKNILRDGGSYLYNTSKELVKYFFGTESHNTIMVGEHDQMVKGPRFIWFDWSEAVTAKWKEESEEKIFLGTVKVYRQLGYVIHQREVRINSSTNSLSVADKITGAKGRVFRQLWHLDPVMKDAIHLNPTSQSVEKVESVKYYSPMYGVLEDSLQIEFQTNDEIISTQIQLM